MKYDELDIVTLTHEIEEYGLSKGDSGTVVSVYNNGEAYEIEFINPNGKTIALLTLAPSDLCSVKNVSVLKWNNEPIWVGVNPVINIKSTSIESITKKFYYISL